MAFIQKTPICDCTMECGDDPFIHQEKCMPCNDYFRRQRLAIIDQCRKEELGLLIEAAVKRQIGDDVAMMSVLHSCMDWTIHKTLLNLTKEAEYRK